MIYEEKRRFSGHEHDGRDGRNERKTEAQGQGAGRYYRVGISQGSCWFLLHRIREAFKSEHPIKMTGPVELDESYFGGLEKNKHRDKKLNAGRGTVGKTAVVGVKDRKTKEVRAEVIPDTTAETLQGFAAENVKPRAIKYTDENSRYEGLPTHQTVSHSTGEYVRKQAHINGMESFWSIMKNPIFVVLACVLPALEAAAEAVPFCLPVDRSQVERHLNPAGAAWPAGKRLADEPRAVRMVYYVVGDGYRAETVAGMKSAILDIQALFGHWTRAHGLGERTFRHETDAEGEPLVHVIYGDSSYYNHWDALEGVLVHGFDLQTNVSVDRRRERSRPRNPERPRAGVSVREDQRLGTPYPIHGGRQVRFQGGS